MRGKRILMRMRMRKIDGGGLLVEDRSF